MQKNNPCWKGGTKLIKERRGGKVHGKQESWKCVGTRNQETEQLLLKNIFAASDLKRTVEI